MNGATQHMNVLVRKPNPPSFTIDKSKTFKQYFNQMLNELNTCVKLGLIQRFDATIGAGTVLMPLGGKYQLTPAEGMAALIPTFNKPTSTASLMAYGFNPFIGE
jgi:phosphoribosylformylglycinamidine synthase